MPWANYYLKKAAYDAMRAGLATTLSYRHPALASCKYITLAPEDLVRHISPGDTVCWLHTLKNGLQAPVLATVLRFSGDRAEIEVTTVDGETVRRHVAVRALRGIPN